MNLPPPSPSESVRLLHDWAGRQEHRRRLTIWITFAIVLHAAAYFLLRAAYPVVPGKSPSRAAILILEPGGPMDRQIAAYLAGEDPALFATDRSAATQLTNPAVPTYRPSFDTTRPPLRPLPEPPDRLPPPLPRDTGPVFVGDGGLISAIPIPPPATQTTVAFGGDLAGRAITTQPDPAFASRPGHQLEAAEYLLAVAPDGRVLHVFERAGTESPEINAVAYPFLLGFHFARGTRQWGTATIHWGTDIASLPAERP